MTAPPTAREREITEPVSLTGPDGRLNPAAIGFARSPLVDTRGIGRGRFVRSWGRNKRWEYWNIMTPTHIVSLTVSSLDYAAVHEVWIHDRAKTRSWTRSVTVLPSREVSLPASLGTGIAIARHADLAATITPAERGTLWRLHAEIAEASFDITVRRPAGHEMLAVVVPWSPRRFQYTVKDVALPASGVLTLDGVDHEVGPGSWAVLDHGRGRWPYDVSWNWGAGSGTLADGRSLGIQVGGRWTDGTGSTENAVVLDGALHKISESVVWDYERAAPLRPWRVHGGGLDAVFSPFYDKSSATNLGVVSSRTVQCFGTWSGTFAGDGGVIAFDGIEGFAEDVRNRW